MGYNDRKEFAGRQGRGPNQETAAATTYAYGEGKSVYVSIDLPLLGAGAGDDSLFAQVFVSTLRHVHSETITPLAGRVLPLQIALTNEGVPVTGRVLLRLPGGVTVVDRGTASVHPDGTLTWEYTLDAGESIELPLWVRLPAQAGDINLRALILPLALPSSC